MVTQIKKMINILLLTVFSIFLLSCNSLNEAGKVLRNEKVNSTDEFLVKKKDPLIMPPDYKKIPEPESINKKKISREQKIKSILNAPKNEIISNNKSSSTEKSILNQIRK